MHFTSGSHQPQDLLWLAGPLLAWLMMAEASFCSDFLLQIPQENFKLRNMLAYFKLLNKSKHIDKWLDRCAYNFRWLHFVVIASHIKFLTREWSVRSGRSLTWSLARVLGPSRNSSIQNFSCWYTVQGRGICSEIWMHNLNSCVTAQHLVVSLSDDRTWKMGGLLRS
jgi:hypothetical protein